MATKYTISFEREKLAQNSCLYILTINFSHDIENIPESRLAENSQLCSHLLQIVRHNLGLSDFKVNHITVALEFVKLGTGIGRLLASDVYLYHPSIDRQHTGFVEISGQDKIPGSQFLFRL